MTSKGPTILFPKCVVTIKIQHNLLSVSIPVLPFNVGHVIYANESPAQHLHIHSVFLNFLDLDPEFFTYVLDILSYSIWSLTFRVCCSLDTSKGNIKCRTWGMLNPKNTRGDWNNPLIRREVPLWICTWFLKNQFEKIKFGKLDF